jgi:hypothetical protein
MRWTDVNSLHYSSGMRIVLNVRLIALAFSAVLISVSAPLPAYANAGRRTPEIYQAVMLDIAC